MPTSPPCPNRGETQTPSSEGLPGVVKLTPGTEGSPWMPADCDEQFALGLRTMTNAHKTKVASLERETRSLRAEVDESRSQISQIQRKLAAAEHEIAEWQQRGHSLKEENCGLLNIINKLRSKIERLENVRNAVLSSIQNGDTGEEDNDRFLLTSDFVSAYAPLTFADVSSSVDSHQDPLYRYSREQIYTGPGATTASPGQRATAFGTQNTTAPGTTNSSLMSPTQSHGESLTLNHPGQHPRPTPRSAEGPPRNFFRVVRQRVDYDRFQQFISIVRKLNSKAQTREESLAQAKVIFGDEHADLMEEFTVMLKKHTVTSPICSTE